MPKMTCAICGSEFVRRTNRPNSRYCSLACRAGKPLSSVALDSSMRACLGCVKRFVAANTQLFCSKACRLSHRWENGGRLRNRVYVHNSKARKIGTATEYIEPERLFERDRWTCGLCHRSIRPALRYPHPQSATIDHIVPMSRGGHHVWDNVQAAHFRCNMVKNSKVEGQLRLSLGSQSPAISAQRTLVKWRPSKCVDCGLPCRGLRCQPCRCVARANPDGVCRCGSAKRNTAESCRSCWKIRQRSQREAA